MPNLGFANKEKLLTRKCDKKGVWTEATNIIKR